MRAKFCKALETPGMHLQRNYKVSTSRSKQDNQSSFTRNVPVLMSERLQGTQRSVVSSFRLLVLALRVYSMSEMLQTTE